MYTETRGITKYRLTQRKEIISLLTAYFKNNPLQGRKALQFSIWIENCKYIGNRGYKN